VVISLGELSTCLAQKPVFSKLSSRDRTELVRLAVRTTYQKGEFIFADRSKLEELAGEN